MDLGTAEDPSMASDLESFLGKVDDIQDIIKEMKTSDDVEASLKKADA